LLKMLRRIISGGQTGADRAGLDFAIHVGLEHGGYVPKGLNRTATAEEALDVAFLMISAER
jgi:hypothetical protein